MRLPRVTRRAWGVPIALCLGLVAPLAASVPPAQAAAPLTASVDRSLFSAHGAPMTLRVSGCTAPASIVPLATYTVTYPWWAAPATSSSAGAMLTGWMCDIPLPFRVLANTTGFDRSGKITVTNGGQTVTLVVSQTKAAAGELNFVGLGDSFSAGVGSSVPYDGTIPSDASYDMKQFCWGGPFAPCAPYTPKYVVVPGYDIMIDVPWAKVPVPVSRRNTTAWPYQMAGLTGLNVAGFWAVGDAVTANIATTAQKGRVLRPQLANTATVPNASVDVVTITVGGNDAGFLPFLVSCVTGTIFNWFNCKQSYVDKVVPSLAGLPDVYRAIVNQYPNATVYVSGYPRADPPDSTSFMDPNVIGSSSSKDWVTIRQFEDAINGEIQRQVGAFNDPRVRFVDITRTDFPGYFARPYVLGGSMFYPIMPGFLYNTVRLLDFGVRGRADIGHPTPLGDKVWAEAVAKAVKGTKESSYGAKAIVTTSTGAWASGGDMCSAFAMTNDKIRALHDTAIPGACPTSAVYTWNYINQRQDFEGGKSIVLPLIGAASLVG